MWNDTFKALSDPTRRQIIKLLKERHGQSIMYSLNTTVIQEAMGWFMDMIGSKEKEEEKQHEQKELWLELARYDFAAGFLGSCLLCDL
jgi:dTDP-D-glucose 4,6-dehydratase